MKLSWSLGRKKAERELEEELRFHMEQEAQKYIANGMSKEEARRQARLAFGGTEATKEECRELRVGHWFELTWQDLRYGLRLLRKSPGFTIVAVAILAMGIGANTAIFSAVNAVLLARWPFRHPEKVVFVDEGAPPKTGWTLISVANFEDYRRDQKTFEQLALWIDQSVNLTGEERPDRLIGSFVSPSFFDIFETRPAMGRLFLPGEDQLNASYVAVLSDEAWRTRFGSDPNILGRHLTLNNESYAVVGVLPRGFRLPFESDVFLTSQHQTSYRRDRSTRSLLMIGRVKDNVSLQQAQADLNTIAQRLARDYPNENAGISVAVTKFSDLTNRLVRKPLLILLGGVAIILLIACANLANLLLARGAQRQREMAVRAALGAARSRMIRQLVSEAMLVAILGGMGGVILAYWTLPVLLRLAPSTFDMTSVPVLDGRVLVFGLLVTLIAGASFGAAPALQLSRINVSSALAAGGRGAVPKITHEKVRAAFVVCQVAMSIVLLTAAGLLVRSFYKLMATNAGMSTRKVLTMEYRLPRNKYASPRSQASFHRELALRVSQVPGVVSSAIVQGLPLSGNWGEIHFQLPDAPTPEKGHEPSSIENYVTPGYFTTIGIPLLRGRNFDDHDDVSAPPVAVVSRAFAKRFFPGQDPVGRALQLVDSDPSIDGKQATIVGVVGDVKQLSLRDTDQAEIYFPYAQESTIFGTLVVRTAVEPMGLAEQVRRAVWSLDKDQPVWKIRTLQFLLERDVEADRFLMVLMSGFGILAMTLSALGTYGILSNAVNQRQQEIGVRMALGAEPGAVRTLVMLQGTRLAVIGGFIGVIVALGASRLMAGVLYGVSALDIWSFVAGLTIMMSVAVAASYVPARRATQVDPMSALRCE